MEGIQARIIPLLENHKLSISIAPLSSIRRIPLVHWLDSCWLGVGVISTVFPVIKKGKVLSCDQDTN